jgi:hypothetical protein
MRCGRCQSLMAQTNEQFSSQSKQAWYKCPACGRSELLSEPRLPSLQVATLGESAARFSAYWLPSRS